METVANICEVVTNLHPTKWVTFNPIKPNTAMNRLMQWSNSSSGPLCINIPSGFHCNQPLNYAFFKELGDTAFKYTPASIWLQINASATSTANYDLLQSLVFGRLHQQTKIMLTFSHTDEASVALVARMLRQIFNIVYVHFAANGDDLFPVKASGFHQALAMPGSALKLLVMQGFANPKGILHAISMEVTKGTSLSLVAFYKSDLDETNLLAAVQKIAVKEVHGLRIGYQEEEYDAPENEELKIYYPINAKKETIEEHSRLLAPYSSSERNISLICGKIIVLGNSNEKNAFFNSFKRPKFSKNQVLAAEATNYAEPEVFCSIRGYGVLRSSGSTFSVSGSSRYHHEILENLDLYAQLDSNIPVEKVGLATFWNIDGRPDFAQEVMKTFLVPSGFLASSSFVVTFDAKAIHDIAGKDKEIAKLQGYLAALVSIGASSNDLKIHVLLVGTNAQEMTKQGLQEVNELLANQIAAQPTLNKVKIKSFRSETHQMFFPIGQEGLTPTDLAHLKEALQQMVFESGLAIEQSVQWIPLLYRFLAGSSHLLPLSHVIEVCIDIGVTQREVNEMLSCAESAGLILQMPDHSNEKRTEIIFSNARDMLNILSKLIIKPPASKEEKAQTIDKIEADLKAPMRKEFMNMMHSSVGSHDLVNALLQSSFHSPDDQYAFITALLKVQLLQEKESSPGGYSIPLLGAYANN